MDAATRFTVPDHVVPRLLGDETVILDLKDNSYFGLNEVGTVIWEAIAEGQSTSEICTKVMTEFDADTETVTADTLALLEQLLEASLILRQGG